MRSIDGRDIWGTVLALLILVLITALVWLLATAWVAAPFNFATG